MARQSYLQRIAQPLRAGDPIMFAIPRAPKAEPHPASDASAPRVAPAKPRAPVHDTTSRAAAATAVGMSDELLPSARAPDEVAAEAATLALPERPISPPDARVPRPVAAPAPRDRAPAARSTESPPATPAPAASGALPPIHNPPVAVIRPPPANDPVAPLRIHIGAVEVRSHTPAPAPRAAVPTARRADAAPISRGYAWRFGFIQG